MSPRNNACARIASITFVLVLLLFALGTHGPAVAQSIAPTDTPATLSPTPTRTAAEIIGIKEPVDMVNELLNRYGWLGALGLLIVSAAWILLSGVGDGMREAIRDRFKDLFQAAKA